MPDTAPPGHQHGRQSKHGWPPCRTGWAGAQGPTPSAKGVLRENQSVPCWEDGSMREARMRSARQPGCRRAQPGYPGGPRRPAGSRPAPSGCWMSTPRPNTAAGWISAPSAPLSCDWMRSAAVRAPARQKWCAMRCICSAWNPPCQRSADAYDRLDGSWRASTHRNRLA
jgi:hypothetical protein